MSDRILQIVLVILAVGAAAPVMPTAPADQPKSQTNAATDGGGTKRANARAGQVAAEVSQEIMSPFCPGKTLAMCTSSQAAVVRRDIQDMAVEGLSKEQIKDKVIKEYGEEFRRVEPTTSDDVPILIAVIVGLLLAATAVFVLTRRSDDGESGDDEPEPTDGDLGDEPSDPYLVELRREYRD